MDPEETIKIGLHALKPDWLYMVTQGHTSGTSHEHIIVVFKAKYGRRIVDGQLYQSLIGCF